jgi:Asp/Glu/hydantoin racemase
MATRLAFIHTSHVLIPLFSQLAREHLPELEIFHMVDESLIRNTIAAEGLTPTTTRRLSAMIGSAHEGGAHVVMVTCSSIGAGVEVARRQFEFPILRVDEAMAERAVEMGPRIGVAATLETTLKPTMKLLQDTAAPAGHCIQLVPSLAKGAFEAVLAGDTALHDRLLLAALSDLMKRVDVVVLAQASMVRVVSQLPRDNHVPILSSPELAVRRARALLVPESSGIAIDRQG